MKSFAQLPVRGGVSSPDVAWQVAYRITRLEGPDAALNSGPRVAIVDPAAAATGPGASFEDEAEYTRPDGASAEGPRVFKNNATVREVSR